MIFHLSILVLGFYFETQQQQQQQQHLFKHDIKNSAKADVVVYGQ